MTSIPLPGSQSNCASAIIDPGHHSARNHEVCDMAGPNIPIGLPSLAIGEDIPASNEPMSFSLQYLLLATRFAFDQGFEPELPFESIPTVSSDDLEDDNSDNTQHGLTASHRENIRASHPPQNPTPKNDCERPPGPNGEDSQFIHDRDSHSEPTHRAQFLNGADSIEDIPSIDLTMIESQNGPADMDAEADTIRVQPTLQRQEVLHEVLASGDNDGAGSVDKLGATKPPPSPAGRQAKRKHKNPSESGINPKKQKHGQLIDYDVTQIIWAQGGEKLRYKLDMAQQRWVTENPIARFLDVAEVYGELLMSEHETVTIVALENKDFGSFDVKWCSEREAFWGVDDLDSDICHEFEMEVMWEKVCLTKKSESGR